MKIAEWSRYTTNVQVLECSSMTHVIDRACAFYFVEKPWKCVEVRPDGVVLQRQNPLTKRNDTIYVVTRDSLYSTWTH